MRRSRAVFKCALVGAGVSLPLAWLALSAGVAHGQEAAKNAQETEKTGAAAFNDLLSNDCVKCHNVTDWAGGLAFDTMDVSHVGEDPAVWEKVVNKLRGRLMPPAGQKQPGQADVDAFVDYLETSLDASAADRGVGHVSLQRLSRIEFADTVKDLLGVQVDPKQVLPTEIEVDGFSNIANALEMSPSFMQQYLSAVRHIAQDAVGEPVPKLASVFYPSDGGTQRAPGANQTVHRDGFPLGTRGGMSFTHVFPADGEYRFSILDVDAGLYPRGVETAATLVILVDGKEVARRRIGGPADLTLADRDGPKGREAIIKEVSNIPAQITAGAHQVIATFIERSWAESNAPTGAGKVRDMPRIQDGIQVVGPYAPHGLSLSASRAKIFICEPKDAADERPCAERIARHLATEAFRRPVTDDDLKWLMKFYDTGRAGPGGFDSGVTELVTAILSSPDFLYRSIATSPTPGQSRELSGLELASRLSFFLWNEGPDAQLLQLGTSGRIEDPAVLKAQVDRMLKDPRAESLVNDFAFSWLNLGTLYQIEPEDRRFTAAMRQDFETEARLFLSSVLLGNHSVTDLLTANYTFLNEALARQYGIRGVYGPQFRRVILKDQNRWGLLGKGAVLLRTSYGDRTSPVLRGEYVLDRIIGTPPTPPPPGVTMDLSIHKGQKPTTVRARLELHRANPTCKGCHGLMDPLGIAMENFDNEGRWRTYDTLAKAPIDSTTTLASGVVLHGVSDLRHYLTRRPDQFPMAVTKRLMMYALNRELEYYDMPQVRKIVRDAAASNYTFASLIQGVVSSDAFRRQGPEKHRNSAPATKTAFNDTRGNAQQRLE